MCAIVVVSFQNRWTAERKRFGLQLFTGSKAAGGCQTKKRREQLMSFESPVVDVKHLQVLSRNFLLFFFGKTGTIQSLVPWVNLHWEVLHISFLEFWLFLMMRCSVVSRCSQSKCSGRSGARRPCNKRRDWQCVYMSCFVKKSIRDSPSQRYQIFWNESSPMHPYEPGS